MKNKVSKQFLSVLLAFVMIIGLETIPKFV